MTAIVISMSVILLMCAVVGAYVAWPHRGAQMPAVPGLGAFMRRAVLWLPTVVAIDDRQTVGQPVGQPVAQEARRD